MPHLPVLFVPVVNCFVSREVTSTFSSAEGASDRVDGKLSRAEAIALNDNFSMRATKPARFENHSIALAFS